MPIYGMMRIKDESRWIERVLRSILPVCDRVFVLDDHSTDSTYNICRRLKRVRVFRSRFQGLDESRDKNFLLQKLYDYIPEQDQHFTKGNPASPYWALAIDGDEELVQEDIGLIRSAVQSERVHSWALRILYLWNSPEQVRVDGVYRNFSRPSLFRLMNRSFTYMSTPFGNGANFHCSSIPQEMIGGSGTLAARLLHWGYIDRELRLKKYEWYNRIDPNNIAEDGYRHMVCGDIFPPESRFRWAGPLKLEALPCVTTAL